MARKKLETLTEQMYYVLLSLAAGPRHGYGVMQYASELTGGRIRIGAGTLYALLDRFESERLIAFAGAREGRRYYQLTEDGRRMLDREYDRLRRQAADWELVLGKEGTT